MRAIIVESVKEEHEHVDASVRKVHQRIARFESSETASKLSFISKRLGLSEEESLKAALAFGEDFNSDSVSKRGSCFVANYSNPSVRKLEAMLQEKRLGFIDFAESKIASYFTVLVVYSPYD